MTSKGEKEMSRKTNSRKINTTLGLVDFQSLHKVLATFTAVHVLTNFKSNDVNTNNK